jgi:hypothetical protein
MNARRELYTPRANSLPPASSSSCELSEEELVALDCKKAEKEFDMYNAYPMPNKGEVSYTCDI